MKAMREEQMHDTARLGKLRAEKEVRIKLGSTKNVILIVIAGPRATHP